MVMTSDELQQALERNKDVDYGNFIIGDWLCINGCGKSFTPRQLVELDKISPFICDCGNKLTYDEAT